MPVDESAIPDLAERVGDTTRTRQRWPPPSLAAAGPEKLMPSHWKAPELVTVIAYIVVPVQLMVQESRPPMPTRRSLPVTRRPPAERQRHVGRDVQADIRALHRVDGRLQDRRVVASAQHAEVGHADHLAQGLACTERETAPVPA